MTVYGFHASHEQISPRQLLADVQLAEQVGFQAAMCSDHLEPWSQRQGHAGMAWPWLGAALATTELTFGTVTAPGQRYHPAIVAQAIATLGQMFPGRFWTALGTGQFANEHVTGQGWPRKDVRQQRLEESVEVIRRLLAGETVSHDGLVTVEEATVWELAEPRPPLIAPAISVATAMRGARWADGLATINQDPSLLREMLDRWADAGGAPHRILQVHLAWAPTEQEAFAVAHDQWRSNIFPPPRLHRPSRGDLRRGQRARSRLRAAARGGAGLLRPRRAHRADPRLGVPRLRRGVPAPRRPAAATVPGGLRREGPAPAAVTDRPQ